MNIDFIRIGPYFINIGAISRVARVQGTAIEIYLNGSISPIRVDSEEADLEYLANRLLGEYAEQKIA